MVIPPLSSHSPFDATVVRNEFPILRREINGRPLAYLDNGATSQKPQAVLRALHRFFTESNANIHRGVHLLSVVATEAYDDARRSVARALGCPDPRSFVFLRGTTEAVNLLATSWGADHLRPGDEILITLMEHHANIVPWQLAARRTGAVLRAVSVTPEGQLDLDDFRHKLTPQTKIAAFTHVSNVLGTVNPVAELCQLCRAQGITTFVDGAQRLPHGPFDLPAIGCDFYAFSGHKMFGPDGIGALYARPGLLDSLPPYQGGGDMVERVTIEHTTFKAAPERFEAGTPNISGAIGLGAAFDFMRSLDWNQIHAHESALLAAATSGLLEIPGLRIQGTVPGKAPIVSFTLDGVHPHDLGTILDTEGVAIRAGHHCAQPLLRHLGVQSTARASFALYNTLSEVEQLVRAVHKAQKLLA